MRGLPHRDGKVLSYFITEVLWFARDGPISGAQAPSSGFELKRPAAFLDRDGVLNADHGYAHRLDQLEWIDGAPAAVRLLNEAGYYVFVATNQSGIARGYYDEAAVKHFHAHMQAALRAQGAHIDAFYYCPHHPEGSVGRYAVACRCRKPGTGLLEQAAEEWPLDRSRSFLIGDKASDLKAAADFGIHGILFDAQAESLVEVVRSCLQKRATPPEA